jgi:hypothetical protein
MCKLSFKLVGEWMDNNTTICLEKIDLRYFNLVKINKDEHYIEIQSRNTKDYWVIKENLYFKDELPIILYHKHCWQQYYHRHWQCHKISQCIKSIKKHDDYSKNKRLYA